MAVTNDEDFRAWLEDQPREVCVAIAYRAAMRVLPLTTRGYDIRQEVLPVFRAAITAAVSARGAATDGIKSFPVSTIGAQVVANAQYAYSVRPDDHAANCAARAVFASVSAASVSSFSYAAYLATTNAANALAFVAFANVGETDARMH